MIVLLRLSAGLIAWAVAFCVIYGLHGIGCANDWAARTVGGLGLQRLVLLVTWASAIVMTVAIALHLSRRRSTILDRVASMTGWIGVAAVVISFVPILLVPECL